MCVECVIRPAEGREAERERGREAEREAEDVVRKITAQSDCRRWGGGDDVGRVNEETNSLESKVLLAVVWS